MKRRIIAIVGSGVLLLASIVATSATVDPYSFRVCLSKSGGSCTFWTGWATAGDLDPTSWTCEDTSSYDCTVFKVDGCDGFDSVDGFESNWTATLEGNEQEIGYNGWFWSIPLNPDWWDTSCDVEEKTIGRPPKYHFKEIWEITDDDYGPQTPTMRFEFTTREWMGDHYFVAEWAGELWFDES